MTGGVAREGSRRGSAWEVFTTFLGLGLTSFGGPVAHLGYFREAFVVRRGWLGERAYADLVALCQFLPGPASSQVGMAIGLQRAGLTGMLAAWTAFTLPSAMALVAFAYGLGVLGATGDAGWLNGLKAAAVAVVAHAVLGMARTLTPDRQRATIAVAAMAAVLAVPLAGTQVVVILLAGAAGLVWLRPDVDGGDHEPWPTRVSRRAALACLVVFAGLLVALPLVAAATTDPTIRFADGFFRSGSLVFGGGHVVLPLLEAQTVQTGQVDHSTFLAGYGAAQAVPGPLFTFAAFLGYVTRSGPDGLLGSALALVAIFLPAALLVAGALPFWQRLRNAPKARSALLGVNAAVVGILAAALYTPVFTAGVRGPASMAVAAVALVALAAWRAPAWAVVLGAATAGAAFL